MPTVRPRAASRFGWGGVAGRGRGGRVLLGVRGAGAASATTAAAVNAAAHVHRIGLPPSLVVAVAVAVAVPSSRGLRLNPASGSLKRPGRAGSLRY